VIKAFHKPEIYSIEKIEERISFYEKLMDELKDAKKLSMNCRLLDFWTQYKHKNYTNAKTKS